MAFQDAPADKPTSWLAVWVPSHQFVATAALGLPRDVKQLPIPALVTPKDTQDANARRVRVARRPARPAACSEPARTNARPSAPRRAPQPPSAPAPALPALPRGLLRRAPFVGAPRASATCRKRALAPRNRALPTPSAPLAPFAPPLPPVLLANCPQNAPAHPLVAQPSPTRPRERFAT